MSGRDQYRRGLGVGSVETTLPAASGWVKDLPSPVVGEIVVSAEERIYFVSDKIYALNPDGSNYVDPIPLPGIPSGSPAIDDARGYVYFGFATSSTLQEMFVVRYDKQLLNPTTVFSGGAFYGGISPLIVADDGTLLVPYGRWPHRLAAVGFTQTTWNVDLCGADPAGSPAINGNAVYVICNPGWPNLGAVKKINLASGEVLQDFPDNSGWWREPMIDAGGNIISGYQGGGIVYVGWYARWDSDFSSPISLEEAGAAYTTSRSALMPDGTSTVRIGYGDFTDRILRYVGQTYWQIATHDPNGLEIFQTPPSVDASGRILIGKGSRLQAIDSTNGTVIWDSPDLGGKILNQPAIARNSAVYVATENNRLVAIGGPSGNPTPTPTVTPSPSTQVPSAAFSFSPPSPMVNQAVQFTSTSTGQSLTYAWDFQTDGVIDSTVANPQFSYTTSGPRNVTLTVTNPYGQSTTAKVIGVGPANSNVPFVTRVDKTYTGFFFKGFDQDNTFNVGVNWNGAPGRARFQINNGQTIEVTGNADGVTAVFNMTAFPPRWLPSELKITPINGAGVVGDTSVQNVYVFPYPTWLDAAIVRLGPDVLNTTVEGGAVRMNFDLDTDPPFKANVLIPEFLVPLGGKLGVPETTFKLKGYFSNDGSGKLFVGGKTGFEGMGQRIEGSLLGGGEWQMVQNVPTVTSGSVKFKIKGTLSQERGIVEVFPALQPLSGIPVIKQFNQVAKFRTELAPSLDLQVGFKQDPSTRDLKFNGTGKLFIEGRGVLSGRITDRIKAEAWAGVGGGFKVGFPQPYLRSFDVTAEAGIRLKFDFLLSSYNPQFVTRYHCKWIPSTGETSCGQDLGEESSNSRLRLLPIQGDYRRFGSYEKFTPASETRSVRDKKAIEQSSVTESTLIENVFPGAQPAILPASSNSKILLYVRQNPELPALQSTDISWSYNDGTSWSSPAVIQGDTQAEMSPVIGKDANGKIVAAWLRNKVTSFATTISTFEQLPEFYKELEVVTSTFDPATRSWSSVTALTDDDALDTSLRLSSDANGKLLLTWQSNPSGEFSADNANPTVLKYSFWNGTAWNEPGVIADNLTNIGEQAAAVNGNNAFVIVPTDPNLDATNDRALLLYSWDGTGWNAVTTFASGPTDNFMPSAVYDSAGQGQVVWLRGTDLVHASLGNPEPRSVRTGSGSMAFYSTRLLSNAQGNLTLVWQEVADNQPAKIFGSIYDVASQTWSRDVRLNDDEWQASQTDGYYDSDGILRLVYLATQINRITRTTMIDGETVEIPNIPENGQTDVRLLEHTLITDLSVTDDGLELSNAQPVGGEAMTAKVSVKNAGDFPVGGFAVSVYAGNPAAGGAFLGGTRVNDQMAGSEVRIVSIPFNYPSTRRDLVAVVDANGEIVEFSESNNVAVAHLENLAPTARVVSDVTSGASPLTVNLNALNSTDPENEVLTYSWNFGDGGDGGSGAQVTHSFTQTGLYPVTLMVTDPKGAVSVAKVNISVNCSGVTIDPSTLPSGATFRSYSQNLTATGGIPPYSFGVTSGVLPVGLSLSPEGLLSGTPSEAGTFNVTISSTYSNGCPGNRVYALTIAQTQTHFDFDGDGRADQTVYRPGEGNWYVLGSQAGFTGEAQWGIATDRVVAADYDGDGRTDHAVYRDGTWWVLNSNGGASSVEWGISSDVPVPADYDGDGKADLAVYRDGTWWILYANGTAGATEWGISTDVPVPADYDGDGKADLAVYRNGTWWVIKSNGGYISTEWGISTDKPVPADYDGDGKADLAVYRDGTWWILYANGSGASSTNWGIATDKPVPADYDGDGKTDLAVYRDGDWWVINSNGGASSINWGLSTDRPIPLRSAP